MLVAGAAPAWGGRSANERSQAQRCASLGPAGEICPTGPPEGGGGPDRKRLEGGHGIGTAEEGTSVRGYLGSGRHPPGASRRLGE